MGPNLHILEKIQIVPGFMPSNMASGPNNGAWVSLKNYGRCAIVFTAAAGAAGQDPTLTLLQATSIAGANSKALNFTDVKVKEASSLAGVGLFTDEVQAAANTFTVAGSGTAQKMWVIDILDENLDVNNGFDCIRATVGDVGTTSQLGSLTYLLHEPRGGGIDGTLPSALA